MITTSIRSFQKSDGAAVRALFVEVNRLLTPPTVERPFQAYIQRCLAEGIERLADYCGERRGGFWVAVGAEPYAITGMFGSEAARPDEMELRRMYVDPSAQRDGIATAMLARAEDERRQRGTERLVLSTSELQGPAIALYLKAGYREMEATIAVESSNRTVGGGIRRFKLEKVLAWSGQATRTGDLITWASASVHVVGTARNAGRVSARRARAASRGCRAGSGMSPSA